MKYKRQGFTLVELSLALTFLTVILITIGYLTIQITSIYEKGLAMKSINAVGKELIDDFSRTIIASPAQSIESLCSSYTDDIHKTDDDYDLCVNDHARKRMYQQRYGTMINESGEEEELPVNGVFCSGRYSYVWNNAYSINDDYKPKDNKEYRAILNLLDGNGVAAKTYSDFRLLKVTDFQRELCSAHMNGKKYAYDDENEYSISGTPEVVEDLLDSTRETEYGSADLAIYDLKFFAPSIHKLTSSGFYSGTFVLATLRGGININTAGEFCSDKPDNLSTDFAYCAMNKFNFAVRAAGEKLNTERW